MSTRLGIFITLLALLALCLPGHSRQVSKGGAGVKVGSFNLWSPNARASDLKHSKTVEARLWPNAVDGIARTIAAMDCDIIAFNEVHGKVLNHPELAHGEEMIARVDSLNGGKYCWQMEFPNYESGKYSFCNGFAYDPKKLKLAEGPVRVWLSNDSDQVSTEAIDGGRTLVYARFRQLSSGKEFWFAVTHLSLGKDGGASYHNASCCVNWALSSVKHKRPCILVGDMNCASESTRATTYDRLCDYWCDAYQMASKAGILSPEDAGTPATRPGTSKAGTGTEKELKSLTQEKNRYDHILLDRAKVLSYSCVRDFYPATGFNASGHLMTGNFWPSDHFPIMANIILK